MSSEHYLARNVKCFYFRMVLLLFYLTLQRVELPSHRGSVNSLSPLAERIMSCETKRMVRIVLFLKKKRVNKLDSSELLCFTTWTETKQIRFIWCFACASIRLQLNTILPPRVVSVTRNSSNIWNVECSIVLNISSPNILVWQSKHTTYLYTTNNFIKILSVTYSSGSEVWCFIIFFFILPLCR